jgi:hypothetical protein
MTPSHRPFSKQIAATILTMAVFATTAGACGPSDVAPAQAAETGRVALPLVTQANGHTYRLRNVFLAISGPEFVQLFDPGDQSQMALSTSLVTGAYTAFLFSGWTLERDDGTGTFSPVVATLISSSAVGFTIFHGATSTVTYRFQTDGVIVTVGAGDVRITASVDEVGAVCTPFGEDCGTGAWCPPTSLTGGPRACMAAGATSLGAPCASPTECVADASCFDVGAGPVCMALCPPSQFDGLCGNASGTCQAVGAEYGICRPGAEGP